MLRKLLVLSCLAGAALAGTVAVGDGVAEIPEGTEIVVRAAPPPSFKVFDRWVGDTEGLADPFRAETVLTMPAGDVQLAATYKDDPSLPPPPADPPADAVAVQPAAETEGASDPDDVWLWVHPTAPASSLIYAADKAADEIVWYDLDGNLVGSLDEPDRPNNIDGRGDFFACSLRDSDEIGLYTVDPDDGGVTRRGGIERDFNVYGFCVYESAVSGKMYGFVSDYSGGIEQWEIDLSDYTGTLVRTIPTDGKVEGIAAHDASGRLFFAEEEGALRVIDAEPDGGTTSTAIASVADPELTDDLEGVALVGDLYVIVSVQGTSEFAVYDMAGPAYAWRGNFEVDRLDGPIDGVSGTDGIAWHAGSFGSTFPSGIFLCHDAANSGGQNIKAVPWNRIATALNLQTP